MLRVINAECLKKSLSIIMLNITNNIFILNVIMPSVIILNVIILNVVAPIISPLFSKEFSE
jgi:hypothetical protein